MIPSGVLLGTQGDDRLDGMFVEKVYGFGGNDHLQFGAYLDGGDGDDVLIDEFLGTTIMIGGAGNDAISDGFGSDWVDAGPGDDYYSYAIDYGHPNTDSDTILLGDGNDIAHISTNPRHGANTFVDGGDGIDELEVGGGGIDILQYVTIDFRPLQEHGTIQIESFTVTGFEKFDFDGEWGQLHIQFGDLDDFFLGGGQNDEIYGNGGDDYIETGGGVGDWLYGGDGDDIIVADGGNSDANHAFGEAGDDLIFYRYKYADYNSNGQLTGGPGSDGFVFVGPPGTTEQHDTVLDFEEGVDWLGLYLGDHVMLDALVTQKTELLKFNVVDNDDVLAFDIDPMLGFEAPLAHVSYDRHTGELYLKNGTREGVQLVVTGAPYLTVDDFYSLTTQHGSDYKDVVRGDDTDNDLDGDEQLAGRDWGSDDIIYGEGGDDNIVAGPGNDTLYGGDGNDLLAGEIGVDVIYGGEGSDTASYASAAAGVVVSLVTETGTVGEAAGDTLFSIENLAGSWLGDVLIGDDQDNILIGGLILDPWYINRPNDGADTLVGGAGDDILDGVSNPETRDEAGNITGGQGDVLLGGSGDDLYKVDSGLDLVDEDSIFKGFGHGGTDTIISTADFYWDTQSVGEIDQVSENVVDPQNDGVTFIGGVFDNVLIGHSGTDVLFGRGGNDVYRAGDGVDFISLSTLGLNSANSYAGVDGHNTVIVDPRSFGPFSYDIVFEFDPSRDKVDVSLYGYDTVDDVLARGVDDGQGNCYFVLGDGLDYLYMVGLEKADLTPADFVV